MADVTISQLTNTTPTTNSILPISKDGVTLSTTLAQLSSLPFIPKAWVNFNGSGAVGSAPINSSFNVSSVTKNSQGSYTVFFSESMLDNKYVVSCSCDSQYVASVVGQTAGSLTITTGLPWTVAYNANSVYVVIYR